MDDNSWYVTCKVQGMCDTDFLIDTGSTHSVISKQVLMSIPTTHRPLMTGEVDGNRIQGFDGSVAEVVGATRLRLIFPDRMC